MVADIFMISVVWLFTAYIREKALLTFTQPAGISLIALNFARWFT